MPLAAFFRDAGVFPPIVRGGRHFFLRRDFAPVIEEGKNEMESSKMVNSARIAGALLMQLQHSRGRGLYRHDAHHAHVIVARPVLRAGQAKAVAHYRKAGEGVCFGGSIRAALVKIA